MSSLFYVLMYIKIDKQIKSSKIIYIYYSFIRSIFMKIIQKIQWLTLFFLLFFIFILIHIFLYAKDENAFINIEYSLIAAYIFYFITVYIPQQKKQKIAKKVLKPFITRLKDPLSMLLAIFDNLITCDEEGIVHLHRNIANFSASIYFKRNDIIYKDSLSFILQKEAKNLSRSLNKIISNPLYQYLENNLTEKLGQLQTINIEDHITRLILSPYCSNKEIYKIILLLRDIFSYLFNKIQNDFQFPLNKEDKRYYDTTATEMKKVISQQQLYKIKQILFNHVCIYIDNSNVDENSTQ